MTESSYIATLGRLTLFEKNNIIVNNVANSSTTGYKKDIVIFKDLLAAGQSSENKFPHFHKMETFIDQSVSSFKETHNSLDFSILNPKHFFGLQTPNGTRYTRSGNFIISKSSTLVSSDGFPVLSSDGNSIVFDTIDVEQIKTDATGALFLADGEQIGKLGVFVFEDDRVLRKEGNNNFFSVEDSQQLGTNYTVMQGFLEESNVNPIVENIELVAALRDAEEMSNISKNINDYLKNLGSLLKAQ